MNDANGTFSVSFYKVYWWVKTYACGGILFDAVKVTVLWKQNTTIQMRDTLKEKKNALYSEYNLKLN